LYFRPIKSALFASFVFLIAFGPVRVKKRRQEADMARYKCDGCGFIYDESAGNKHEGFAPGTAWSDIPEDWACPDCAVREKPDFNKLDD